MKLPYELAKELKDAGFPQKGTGLCKHNIYGSEFRESCDCSGYPDRFKVAEIASIPTLSELIEALDWERAYIKFSLESAKNPTEWLAQLWSKADCPFATGPTPEEAVARLWLALNKKDV